MNTLKDTFTHPLLEWYQHHGRDHLPWKSPIDPYRIWLSEIMLQQTQVVTVIPYFLTFIERFPTITALAEAQEDDVLALWSGLGYYSRGRNLHKTAQIIATTYQGIFPIELALLKQLPGIGPSTAAAILSQAFNQPTPIMDGNVKRVLSRYFMIEGYSAKTTQQLWALANECMSHTHPADYTQAIMDLGATCCTNRKPQCLSCPLRTTCLAYRHDVVVDFPHKKPKKKLPTKAQQFLLIHNELDQIYLEKRPSIGIWGGMWCTPTLETEMDPIAYIETTYAQPVLNIQPLMSIRHTFTHFKLHIHAHLIQLKQPATPLPQQGRWFSKSETQTLGIPKPVNDLIQAFYQGLF